MAITALVCVAIGAAVLIVTFTADGGAGDGGRIETRTLAMGAAFVVAGVLAGAQAVRGD